ncbi:MAG TPA: hypothetical protein VNL70_02550 [Tepidisphaeraceae bacterium]|nr:hypothetical protein [Tepidisphaeraceae bacterium]
MPLPPKGDPRRPLHLAVRSMRLLGIVLLILGSFSLMPVVAAIRRGPDPRFAFAVVTVLMVYVVPGVLYLLGSVFLSRRRPWAIVVGLVLASVQLIFCLLGLIILLAVWTGQSDESFGIVVAGAATVLLSAAFAQLIYHLAKSFEAIRHPPIEELHAFQPLMVEPIDADNSGLEQPTPGDINRSSGSC